jgi:hypothetical protein
MSYNIYNGSTDQAAAFAPSQHTLLTMREKANCILILLQGQQFQGQRQQNERKEHGQGRIIK